MCDKWTTVFTVTHLMPLISFFCQDSLFHFRDTALPRMVKVGGGPEFQWDSPLPPAPGSKLSLSHMKDMHSKYCEYWRLVRKRMHNYTSVGEFVMAANL